MDGSTLGAAGGDQRIGTHGHAASQGAHSHSLNDPGHVHAVRTGGDSSYGGGVNGGVDLLSPFIFRGENTQAATTGITIANATPPITVTLFRFM